MHMNSIDLYMQLQPPPKKKNPLKTKEQITLHFPSILYKYGYFIFQFT